MCTILIMYKFEIYNYVLQLIVPFVRRTFVLLTIFSIRGASLDQVQSVFPTRGHFLGHAEIGILQLKG